MKKILLILLVLSHGELFSQVWYQTLNGITIWSLAKDMGSNIYAGSTGSNSRIFKSTNSGVNWDTISTANGQTVFSMAFDSLGHMFVANSTAGLLKSTNGGLNFTVIPISVFGSSGLQAVVCGKNGYVYVATNGSGIYRSVDTGATFTQSGLSSMQVVSLLVDRFNPAFVYAGATQTNGGFYRSTDFGASYSANLNAGKNIFGVMQFSQSVLYSVTTSASGSVDKSTDGGLTWNSTATGYVSRGIANSPFGILIAGNGGLFISTNSGSTFTNYGITISSTPVLTIGSVTLVGVSGTNGGVYYNLGPLGLTNNGIVANSFQLFQNYPNPFNPSTKIRFDIPSAGQNHAFDTRIDIYDARGKKLETLVNQQLPPGSYSIDWDASNYPSGIYFYKLRAGYFSKSMKMIVIK
jgi:photosystem II stability/assembly factor-like uncharacterized protein